jgi:hypothetical protein
MAIQNNFPAIRPSLLLDFANSKRLDPRVTFIRASTATFFDASGILQIAATGVARFDHNPVTGESLGLLVENQRINIALHNRDLTQAAWVATSATTAKDQTGIDRVASSASKITATGANATVLQTVTTGSASRTMSAYVRRITGTGVVEMTTNDGTNWDAVTVTSAWTRVTIPERTVTNPVFGFRLVTSGDEIAVDFVQNEVGAFATSAILTAGSAVTRTADVALMTGTNFSSWYNASEGTIYGEASSASSAVATQGVAQFDDGTANNRIRLARIGTSSVNLSNNIGGLTDVSISLAGVPVSTMFRIAAAYKLNDYAASLNAGTVGTDTTASVPVVNQMEVAGAGGNTLMGHLRKLAYYPLRLTNAQLQAITG